jgi:hypothetical protein
MTHRDPILPVFADEVSRRFSFLKGLGFVEAVASPDVVLYKSDSVLIEVRYCSRGGEVSVDFGRPLQERLYSYGLYLRLFDRVHSRELGYGMARNVEEMRSLLDLYATTLGQVGQPIVSGDDAPFEAMSHVSWADFQTEPLE